MMAPTLKGEGAVQYQFSSTTYLQSNKHKNKTFTKKKK